METLHHKDVAKEEDISLVVEEEARKAVEEDTPEDITGRARPALGG